MPLIALSSLGSSTYEFRAQSLGFECFLTKFNSQELLMTINGLCHRTGLKSAVSA